VVKFLNLMEGDERPAAVATSQKAATRS